jgi:hypothetical protein
MLTMGAKYAGWGGRGQSVHILQHRLSTNTTKTFNRNIIYQGCSVIFSQKMVLATEMPELPCRMVGEWNKIWRKRVYTILEPWNYLIPSILTIATPCIIQIMLNFTQWLYHARWVYKRKQEFQGRSIRNLIRVLSFDMTGKRVHNLFTPSHQVH